MICEVHTKQTFRTRIHQDTIPPILSKDIYGTANPTNSGGSTIWIGPSPGCKGLLRIFEVASAGEDRYLAQGAGLFGDGFSEDEKVYLLTTHIQNDGTPESEEFP